MAAQGLRRTYVRRQNKKAGAAEEMAWEERALPEEVEGILVARQDLIPEWTRIKVDWLSDVYILQKIPEHSNQGAFDAEFLDWLETKYERFCKVVMHEGKIMALMPSAPRFETMILPLRSDNSLDPVGFKKLFYDFARRGDIFERDGLESLLQRMHTIFAIPADLQKFSFLKK